MQQQSINSKKKSKMSKQHPHPRTVRRGNTSGLIGLWNQKSSGGGGGGGGSGSGGSSKAAGGILVVTEFSSGVDADSLAIRERANRRISVR